MSYLEMITTSWIWSSLFYGLPGVLCIYGYTIRTWKNYQKDTEARESDKYYMPTDTIGTLLGRGLVSIVPVANLLAATFDIGPKLFANFFKWIGRVFDQPLVPKKPTP